MSTTPRRTHGNARIPVDEAARRVTRAYVAQMLPRRRGSDAAALADARRALALVKGRR